PINQVPINRHPPTIRKGIGGTSDDGCSVSRRLQVSSAHSWVAWPWSGRFSHLASRPWNTQIRKDGPIRSRCSSAVHSSLMKAIPRRGPTEAPLSVGYWLALTLAAFRMCRFTFEACTPYSSRIVPALRQKCHPTQGCPIGGNVQFSC